MRSRIWRMLAAIGVASGVYAGGPDRQPPGDSPREGTGAKAAAPARDVGPILLPIIKRHDVPGMCAAVVELEAGGGGGGMRIEAIGAVGVRKRGSPDAVTAGDQFHIGSCTKAMTATMIGALVEEGKLSWKTTVGETFPELHAKLNEQWRAVTLEQLLTHRAGAPADLQFDGLWGRLWERHGSPTEQRMMLVEGVVARPPESAPGTKFLYANSGFAIAGAMAERATGRAWEDLMRERVFVPLGMDSAGFGAPGRRDTLDQPRGHHEDGSVQEVGPGSDNPAAIAPGGAVHCTIGDWAKFVALHLRRRARAEPKGAGALALSDATLTKLHTPPAGTDDHQYAMGWSVTKRDWAQGSAPGDAGRVLTHNGSNTMWFCVAWLAPEKKFAVLVMCNQGGEKAEKACDEAASALIQDRAAHAIAAGGK